MSMTHSLEGNETPPIAETTPLLSQSTSKRSKPYTNLLGLPSKRRLHVKFRHNHKQLGAGNGKVEDDSNDEQLDQEDVSNSAVSPSPQVATEQDAAPLAASHHKRSLNPLDAISLTLENSGSVARDHLASERTFLAYVRTSLAMASSGVALVQLFTIASANLRHYPEHRLHKYIRPLGAVTIVLGLIVLVMGVVRYFSVQAALTKGKFPVARALVGFVATALTVLVVVTFGILIAGKLEPPVGRH